MIIKEIQKRPFFRPLFVWITGILLQAYFDCRLVALLFLLFPSMLLLFSYLTPGIQKMHCEYGMRWLWGALFLLLLLSFSIQRTAWWQDKGERPVCPYMAELCGRGQEYLLSPFENLHLSDEEKSVLATITLGYRKGMDREVRKSFSTTGVAHLLAVSGFHVAIVCGFLSMLFSFFPKLVFWKWMKYLLTMCLLWSFVIITGFAASAIRAGLMLSLYLTGRMLRRRTDGYNTLAASAFCMLVFDPFYLFDIGFQLSYLAVLSILYLQPRLQRLIKVRNPIIAAPWGWITVTLAAQMGTTLLCLYYFGQFSLVFLCTNLPLTLLSAFLIPAGLIWILLPAGFPGYDMLQLSVEKMTHVLLQVVEAFSRVPGATCSFRIGLLQVLLGYGVIFFLLFFLQTKRPRFLLVSLCLIQFIMFDLLIERFFTG